MKFAILIPTLLAATVSLGLSPALAAATSQELCKDGQIVVVRISTIKPNGSRAGFDKAVKDQLAWYRAHGFATNNLFTSPVLSQDATTKAWSVSEREVMTLHTDPPATAGLNTQDPAWVAFVTQFRANSDIASERTVCLQQPLK